MNKKNETVRYLRVTYTDPERLELGKQLAEVHQSINQINSDFDRVKSEFKSKLTAEEAKVVDLANKVASGYRMMDVKCIWRMDDPKPGAKTLLRLDAPTTEEAIVEIVPMTEADKQGDLPLETQPGGADMAAAQAEIARAGVAGDGSVVVPADKSES